MSTLKFSSAFAALLAGGFFLPATAMSAVIVDNNSGLVTGTGSTPITGYTVNAGDDMTVLEICTRTNTPGMTAAPTYTPTGGSAANMTLAASLVSVQGTNRAVYIYILPTPTAGTGAFNISYSDVTGNDFAYAFNLKNVNLSNLPTPTNLTGTIDTQGSPTAAAVTINNIPADGALGLGVQFFGLTSGDPPGTFSASSSGSETGVQQYSSPNNNSTDGQGVYFANLVGGNETFTFNDAGAIGTKDVLDLAVFDAASSAPEPASLGIVGIAALGLLARRRRQCL